MKFIIIDWAGNVCFKGQEFNLFADADEFLSEKFENLDEAEYEIERGEYAIYKKHKCESYYCPSCKTS